ncbi:hypothetical protein GCM10009665_71470 [Kitasatospora nipponensis]|uniref:Uncharacterized protein n=1 Tax=Kitasatospora nipponensis TaxID=258049 RepID=A0ABN1WZ68_9ACTN
MLPEVSGGVHCQIVDIHRGEDPVRLGVGLDAATGPVLGVAAVLHLVPVREGLLFQARATVAVEVAAEEQSESRALPCRH